MNDYSFILPPPSSEISDPLLPKFLENCDAPLQYVEQLVALKEISRQISNEVVIWDTVFNPWFTTRRHIIFADINQQMHDRPSEMHALLDFVTNSIITYIEKSAQNGSDGFYYSVPAAPKYLTRDDFHTFMKPYDTRVLQKIRETGKTLALHVHGTGDVYLDDVARQYDFDCLSWSSQNTSFNIAKAKKLTNKILMTGVNEENEFNYRPFKKLEKEIDDALLLMQGRRFILSPGCVLPPQCPTERMQYMFDYARAARDMPVTV